MATSAANGVVTRAGFARVQLAFPAKAEYITLGRLALAGLVGLQPLSEETLGDLRLALTEACTNCVRHAYLDGPGVVEITYELEPGRLVVEVSDDGCGFDYTTDAHDAEELAEGGLGIAIIRALSDEFELGRRENGAGSRLRFVKLFPE